MYAGKSARLRENRPEMIARNAILLAAGAFVLGLVLGRTWQGIPAVAGPNATDEALAGLPPGHPQFAERGLGDAIRTTMQTGPGPADGPPQAATAPVSAPAQGPAPWLAQADQLRRKRDFQAATDMYRRAIAVGGMTADAWADYADALASATSSLRGEPAQALDAALALEPRHPKALWLKASLEHEERRYAEAARTWQALLALVPADSSDATIIRANLAEAQRLASGKS